MRVAGRLADRRHSSSVQDQNSTAVRIGLATQILCAAPRRPPRFRKVSERPRQSGSDHPDSPYSDAAPAAATLAGDEYNQVEYGSITDSEPRNESHLPNHLPEQKGMEARLPSLFFQALELLPHGHGRSYDE